MLAIIATIIFILIYITHRHNAAQSELRDRLSSYDTPTPRLKISVIVSGLRSIDYIASLLKSESSSYQIIVVADYATNPQLLNNLKRYFSLHDVSYVANGELPQRAIRNLYRSHTKLFSNVIVVDSPTSKEFTPFEVGATISSYNFNLQISSQRTLRPKSISNLLLELSMRNEGDIEEITSAIGEHFRLVCREAALPAGEHKIEIGKSKKLKLHYRLLA